MMQEFRDPSIRLFGRTIQLAPNYDVSGEQTSDHNNLCSVSLQTGSDKNSTSNENDHHSESKSSNNITADDDEDSNNNKKPLKKPTKILPCPRCNSTDTKFCYFNNYNVNQPRHFCKDCQRYWTSGGSMRNMPIGSGRRKTKNMTSSSSCHHESQDSLKPASIMAFQPIWPAFGFPVQMTYAPSPYCCWMTPASASHRPNSPLGKHPRDTSNKMEKKKTTSGSESSESSVLVTKTIRFDDPIEAAQSSIWTTLGNKSQKNDNNSTSLDSSVFFGGFDQSKSEETSAASRRMLQANPAALSRALTFQESAE